MTLHWASFLKELKHHHHYGHLECLLQQPQSVNLKVTNMSLHPLTPVTLYTILKEETSLAEFPTISLEKKLMSFFLFLMDSCPKQLRMPPFFLKCQGNLLLNVHLNQHFIMLLRFSMSPLHFTPGILGYNSRFTVTSY